MSGTDLHLCQPAETPKSSDSQCECPPEYYCANLCGEDYSLSTLISWQHFPRSTSSRSHCDDSSETIQKSVSDTPVREVTPQKSESGSVSDTQYPITKSFSQLNALHYLEIRHIFKLFNFMIGHLVCNEPTEPVPFLEDLLGQCIKFRDFMSEPPLLFTRTHLQSLYNAFDPFERGYLTPEQYVEALGTLGITNGITKYNEEPGLTDDGYISDTTFMFEAERCLLEDLKQMLKIPFPVEDNRLKWQRMMITAPEKSMNNIEQQIENMSAEDTSRMTPRFCDCFGNKQNTSLICRCPHPTSLRIEPEQLFLDNH